MEGEGKLTWPDGSSYEGGFKAGLPNGKGFYKANASAQPRLGTNLSSFPFLFSSFSLCLYACTTSCPYLELSACFASAVHSCTALVTRGISVRVCAACPCVSGIRARCKYLLALLSL